MLITLPILLSLSIIKQQPPNRMAIHKMRNAGIIRRYKVDPSGFNPHFLKSDPAAHPTKFVSNFESQGKAQEFGEKRHKNMMDSINENRIPLALQIQMRLGQ